MATDGAKDMQRQKDRGAEELAAEVDAPYLGELALRSSYRDNSKPTSLADSDVAGEYSQLAQKVKDSLKSFGKDAT